MALQPCHECGTQISSEAKTCPQCGVARKNKSNAISQIIGGIFVVGVIWVLGGGLEKQTTNDMRKIEAQVASDAVKQYQITKKSGTPIDICAHAGIVSAAFLQANDDENYATWKRIEAKDCDIARVP